MKYIILPIFLLSAAANSYGAQNAEITDERVCSNTLNALLTVAISHRNQTGQIKKIGNYEPEQVEKLMEKYGACKTMNYLKIKPIGFNPSIP